MVAGDLVGARCKVLKHTYIPGICEVGDSASAGVFGAGFSVIGREMDLGSDYTLMVVRRVVPYNCMRIK